MFSCFIIISSRSEGLAFNSFNIFKLINSIQTQNIHLNWESIASVFLIVIIHNFRDILRFSPIFSHSSRLQNLQKSSVFTLLHALASHVHTHIWP